MCESDAINGENGSLEEFSSIYLLHYIFKKGFGSKRRVREFELLVCLPFVSISEVHVF